MARPPKSTSLKLDWATQAAARYACQNFHYSKKLPVSKLSKIGVWEDEKFIGVVIFGVGASAVLHNQFDIGRFEVCELVRVALKDGHATPCSRIIAIAIKLLRKANPKLRVCVSFADPAQNHHGGIYQAGGWIYAGKSVETVEYYFGGKWRHVTRAYKQFTPEQIKSLKSRKRPGKHRYIFPFDAEMRALALSRAEPYPKRASEAEGSKRPKTIRKVGGSSPTQALQKRRDITGG